MKLRIHLTWRHKHNHRFIKSKTLHEPQIKKTTINCDTCETTADTFLRLCCTASLSPPTRQPAPPRSAVTPVVVVKVRRHEVTLHPSILPPPLFFLLSVCTCWSVLAQLSWDLFTCKMRSQCSPAECPSWLRPPRRPRAADPPPSKYIWHTHVPTHSSSHLNGLWAPENVSYPGCSSQSWRNRKLFTAPEKNAHASRRCRLITLLEG